MAATVLGYPIGPILGGWLLTTYWWGSVFLINVPVVVIALIAWSPPVAGVSQREGAALRSARYRHFEPGLAVLVYGVIEAGQKGWGNRRTRSR